MSTNNKISSLVSSQVPFFVRNDHQNFIVFLEKYYEYLEQNGKVIDRAKSLGKLDDIDITEDIFAEKLYDQYLKLLPKTIVADKKLLLKYAKDFYRSKGTENSISFLLNVIFGEDTATFYYPKNDILRASDGKWFIEKSLRITNITIDNIPTTNQSIIERFTSRQITGQISKATALVESVETYYDKGTQVYELKISNQFKDFVSGEIITANYVENNVTRVLKATTFLGVINSVEVLNGGTGYVVGTSVPIESNSGSGGIVVITGTTRGNLSAIGATFTGAGFQSNDNVIIAGGGGSGAAAYVTVKADGVYHPNSYNIISSTISLEANTPLSNSVFSNLYSVNANSSIISGMSTFTYANTGPIDKVILISPGNNYTSIPSFDVQSNTAVRELGVLGRLQIVNGGTGYQIGDEIEFINQIGGYGTGARANVTNVAANGMITAVQFIEVPGHIIGGAGYEMSKLPTANVISANGSNANILVRATLGDGEVFISSAEQVGKITQLSIVSGGNGYTEEPTLNLSAFGDGTAQAVATIISGVFSFPGRFLNDDGMVSSFNYLEDKDYYQNYSYVVRINKSFDQYKKTLLGLTHPSGMKLFGEYLFVDEFIPTIATGVKSEGTNKNILKLGNYYSEGNANGSDVWLNIPSHGLQPNNNVYVEFITGSTGNIANVSIIDGGQKFSNGFIAFDGGSGLNANAYVSVDANGTVTSITMINQGTAYGLNDVVTANTYDIVTAEVASVVINNPSLGHSNGFIKFEGGTGRSANAYVTVNSIGSIVNIAINNSGLGYHISDFVAANVDSLVGYNVASINVATGGTGYSNGFINFIGGSGTGANASVNVNSTGSIVNVTINDPGFGYLSADLNTFNPSVSHLKTYRIDQLLIGPIARNYKDGYINFEGGAGSNANATITVNPFDGTIISANLISGGNNYIFSDTIKANVEHLLTYNIANVGIVNAGYGYSNGYITFEGGSGRNANAYVETYGSNGTIKSITINNRGTGYEPGDTVIANVNSLLTSNINTISINDAGSKFKNGFIRFEGGSGRSANARVIVNSAGSIVSITVFNRGIGYLAGETVRARVSHLMTYIIDSVNILDRGLGYSNGYITFEGGSGNSANANISVDERGSIVSVTMFNKGINYTTEDYLSSNVTINLSSLIANTSNYTPAVLRPVLALGNTKSANITVTLVQAPNTANLPVTIQRGSGNANVTVQLTANGDPAIFNLTLQKIAANAELGVVLQRSNVSSNLVVNLQPENLNIITNSLFKVANSNTNWFIIQHPNTANIVGTAYASVVI